MKKVLFATTALVATAGVASAEITLSGMAEMGIFGGDSIDTQFHTDIDVTFTMSGETDNGLTFGATIDLSESDGSGSAIFSHTCDTRTAGVDLNGGGVIGIGDDYSLCDDGTISGDAVGASNAFGAATQGGETIFISGNFGTLTMGDTDGGYDWALSEVPTGSGSINAAESGHAGFNGNSGGDGTYDGQILRYDHSVAGFGFAVSLELDDSALDRDPIIGLGLTYSADLGAAPLDIGIGYQEGEFALGDDMSVRGISLGTSVSGIDLGLNYSVAELDSWAADQTHMGIGASYSMDAITVGVNYGQYDDLGGVSGDDSHGWGLSAGYDLGGGASVLFGYGTGETTVGGVSTDSDSWSLGVSMSF